MHGQTHVTAFFHSPLVFSSSDQQNLKSSYFLSYYLLLIHYFPYTNILISYPSNQPCPPVGIIIGHSFVHSLHSYLSNNNDITGTALASQLCVDQIIQSFHIHGQCGAKICTPFPTTSSRESALIELFSSLDPMTWP